MTDCGWCPCKRIAAILSNADRNSFYHEIPEHQDLRFSQHCWWRLKCFGIWHHLQANSWRLFGGLVAFIFKKKEFKKSTNVVKSALLYRHWGSVQAVRPIGGVEVQLYSSLTSALEGGEGVSVTPRPLFTPGKDPVPIVQEAGWAPGPVWTGAENIAPTGIRFPDRPTRTQSLYRLRYPANKGRIHVTNISETSWTVYHSARRYTPAIVNLRKGKKLVLTSYAMRTCNAY